METFCPAKPMQPNPDFSAQRKTALAALAHAQIDPPIRRLINRLNQLEYCFTLQACWGHFVHPAQPDPHNLDRLPDPSAGPERLTYRIAYLALCVRADGDGQGLLELLQVLARAEPGYIQYGCADWFWRRQVNSYVIQVEPISCKHLDQAVVSWDQACRLQEVRDGFFANLSEMLTKLK